MKLLNRTIFASALAVSILVAGGCQQKEESGEAQAVLASETNLTFAATSAEPQTISVYSDAQWHLTNGSDWITVDKANGTGVVDVTISVSDNLDGSVVDVPRVDTLVFSGSLLRSRCFVRIFQEGDTYRYAQRVTVSDLATLAEGTTVILESAQVVALTSTGFAVISDGAALACIPSASSLKIGDNISLKGTAGYSDGLPAIVSYDDLTVSSNGEVSYGAATDITAELASFTASGLQYVSADGVVSLGDNGYVLNAKDVERGITIVNPASDLGIAALNGHKAVVYGYVTSSTDATINLIATAFEDKGVDQLILFQDDFSWVHDMAHDSGAGDSMGKSTDDNAVNAYGSKVTGFADALAAQGYIDLFPSSKTIYLQTDYLKFSKNKNVNGIGLPKFDLQGYSSVVLEFDWGVHVGGGGPDATVLEVVIDGNGDVSDGASLTHPQTADGTWEWKHETIHISGLDADSRILIRPTDFTGTVASKSLYRRWYLDNVKVTPGEGGGPVTPATYFEDDFEWCEPYAVVAGSDDIVSLDQSSANGAKNIYTEATLTGTEIEGMSLLDNLHARGYTDLNPSDQTIYLQRNYFKFGKKNKQSGFILPALAIGEGVTAKATLTFDWCVFYGGTFKVDTCPITVTVTGAGKIVGGDSDTTIDFTTTQKGAESGLEEAHMYWMNQSVEIEGVTSETRIQIAPKYLGDSKTSNYQRWFLDNIKVVQKL